MKSPMFLTRVSKPSALFNGYGCSSSSPPVLFRAIRVWGLCVSGFRGFSAFVVQVFRGLLQGCRAEIECFVGEGVSCLGFRAFEDNSSVALTSSGKPALLGFLVMASEYNSPKP